MNLFLLNIILALAWAAVTGNFEPYNLALGFVIGSIALWLPMSFWGDTKYFRRSFLMLRLFLLFLYELVLSSLRVAADVLRPRMQIEPGIIELPLDAKRDIEITLLANLITLTPGTLSLDVSRDRKSLFVHALHTGDPEGLKKSIKEGFERKVMEALE
jgi:multicomponent Na+:H+ antiporter subunit E